MMHTGTHPHDAHGDTDRPSLPLDTVTGDATQSPSRAAEPPASVPLARRAAVADSTVSLDRSSLAIALAHRSPDIIRSPATQVLRRNPDHVGTEPATRIDQTERERVDPRSTMPAQRAVAEEADRAVRERLLGNAPEMNEAALLGRGICVSLGQVRSVQRILAPSRRRIWSIVRTGDWFTASYRGSPATWAPRTGPHGTPSLATGEPAPDQRPRRTAATDRCALSACGGRPPTT